MGRGIGRQAIQPNQQAFGLQTPQMPTSPGPGSPQTPQPIGGKNGMPPMHFGPQTPSQPGMPPGNLPGAQPGVLATNNNIPILQRPPGLQAQPYPGLQGPPSAEVGVQPLPYYGDFSSPNMTPPPPQMQPGLPGLLGMRSPDQMPPMQAQPLPFDPQRQQQLMQLAMQKQPSIQEPMTSRGIGDAQYLERLNFVRQQLDNRGIPQQQIQQQLMQQQTPMLDAMQKQLEQARQSNLPMADQFKMREDMQKTIEQQNALRQQMLGQQGMGQQAALRQQTLSQPVQTAQYTSPALQQTMRQARRSRARV